MIDDHYTRHSVLFQLITVRHHPLYPYRRGFPLRKSVIRLSMFKSQTQLPLQQSRFLLTNLPTTNSLRALMMLYLQRYAVYSLTRCHLDSNHNYYSRTLLQTRHCWNQCLLSPNTKPNRQIIPSRCVRTSIPQRYLIHVAGEWSTIQYPRYILPGRKYRA